MAARFVMFVRSFLLSRSLVRASRQTIGGSASWHKEDMINCHYN